MPNPQTAPFGSWRSPITSDWIVAQSIGLGAPALEGDDLYWIEVRIAEGGRYVVVKRAPDGRTADITAPPFNVRTRVHEYGGGAFVAAGGAMYFSDFADQRLYRLAPGGAPRPLTPAGALRFADARFDRRRNLLYCVREDHGGGSAVNTLVTVKPDGDEAGGRVIVQGNDFYSTPRLSPDASRLAWLTWNHPNMPWDGTALWVGELADDGSVTSARRVAGGAEESVFQPEWSPDGVLHFVSDRTGWWNLYRYRNGQAEPLCPMEAEFGRPQWVFGMSTYAFESAGRIVCAYARQGVWHLGLLDAASGELQNVPLPYTEISEVRAAPGRAVFVAASPAEPLSIVQLDLASGAHTVVRRSSSTVPDAEYVSIPQEVEFPTENGWTAYGLFYRPRNRDFAAPPGDRPPLLVFSHGGPTGAASSALDLEIQYWTSRGFGVLDVNYGGSTGYGRAYRMRLNGQWGVVDVDDCVNGARHLVAQGEADGDRLCIRGGSAGGYTTLAALTFRQVFKAGASYYGVSDLEALAKDTHKFESRYLDNLVGPYPARRDIYVARSPLHHTHRLSCALILFQGLEDKVVPPAQAQTMFEAVRAKELPVAYLPFEGEQHGFRKAETIKRTLDAELYFYSKVLGFAPADAVEPVAIENLQP
jgi:dipeptidyl aminopeptidase/acylaminoacyl peptidase